MERHAPWIECMEKNCNCILARDEKAYYIVKVGKRLDYATEEWLESQGVSEKLLKELQLPFEYIPKKAIQGVAISGSMVRQNVILHLKSNKRKLTLQRDYDPDWLEEYFKNIPRFIAPKAKPEQSGDWREAKQDRALFEKLRFVSPVCMVLGIVGSIGFALTRHWAFFTLCLLLIALEFGLLIGMPEYFTYEIPKVARRKHVWELELPMTVMYLILILSWRMNWLDNQLWAVGSVAGIAVAVVLCGLIPDFRSQQWAWLGVLIFGSLGGLVIIGTANEVYDFSENSAYILEVEDTHSNRGRRTSSYYCTVTLPDGREEDLHISRSLYKDLEAGDLVLVEVGEGFFGIEYANVYPYEEGE